MKKLWTLCAVLVLLTVLLTGCGTDNGDTATTTTAADTAVTTTLAASADPTTTEAGKPAASTTVSTTATITANSCQHTRTEIAPAKTGNHVIDDSKQDMLVHAVKCKDCKQQVRLENHTVSGNTCSACGQANFALSETGFIEFTYFDKAGTELIGVTDNGTLNYEAILSASYYLANLSKNKTAPSTYKIPEAEMFDAINRVFVFSKGEFEKLKAQGTYVFLQAEQTYKDGYFYIDTSNDGGRYQYTKTVLGYTDDQKGTFTIYIDLLNKATSTHQDYYAIAYRYTGTASNLYLYDLFGGVSIMGWEPLLSSLRVTAVKKVAAPDSAMKAPEAASFGDEY